MSKSKKPAPKPTRKAAAAKTAKAEAKAKPPVKKRERIMPTPANTQAIVCISAGESNSMLFHRAHHGDPYDAGRELAELVEKLKGHYPSVIGAVYGAKGADGKELYRWTQEWDDAHFAYHFDLTRPGFPVVTMGAGRVDIGGKDDGWIEQHFKGLADFAKGLDDPAQAEADRKRWEDDEHNPPRAKAGGEVKPTPKQAKAEPAAAKPKAKAKGKAATPAPKSAPTKAKAKDVPAAPKLDAAAIAKAAKAAKHAAAAHA